MTENPTILSPSGPSQPPSLANSTATPEDAEDPSGEINCICEISDDDGFTICCDGCDTWQHLVCVQLTKENLPAKYYCPKCSPRWLDIPKAKEIQRQRRAEEQAKRSHKKKRPATTSHKKKEHPNGSNGSMLGKSSSTTEKATVQGFGKPPSPKEMQQPASRKRGHRASQSTNAGGSHLPSQPAIYPAVLTNHNATTSPDSPNIVLSTRNGDTGSDTDHEKSTKQIKHELTSISADQYVDRSVQDFVEKLASPTLENPAPQGDFRVYYTREQFASINLPKTSARPLPDFSKAYSDQVRWSLVLETPVLQGQLVAIYKGEVAFTKSYQSEVKIPFDVLRYPKLFVFFHPSLPIYIDARRFDSEARFIRRHCRPNLEVRTVVIDNSEVRFGLFAKDAIKTGTQLTLSWDMGDTLGSSELEQDFDWNLVRNDTLNEIACWAGQLIEKIGDCPCLEGNDCPLARVKSGVSKPHFANGTRRKPPKRNPSTEPAMPIISKEPSPERNPGLPNDEEEEDNRSVSAPSSRSKPRSRDLTPSTVPDTAVETGEMTGREARKFKEVLSRIEKQQQEEQLPQSVKRRKRNSTVSLPTGTLPLPSPGIESRDGMKAVDTSKKQRLPAGQRSPYSPPVTTPGSISALGEYTVTDASVGRRDSDSPVHSEPGKPHRRVSVSPVEQCYDKGPAKHRTKTIAKPPRPQYVNAAVQTDDVEDETPWWRQDPKMSPPRPPRLPLRKRLMQSLLRDREEAVVAPADDRKRKYDDITSQSSENTPTLKSIKLSCGESAPVQRPSSTDIKQFAETESSIALRWAAANNAKSAAQDPAIHVLDLTIIKPPPHRPPGPALADIFADSDFSTSRQAQGAAVPLTSPPELSQGNSPNDQPHINGFRSSGLHLQLPPSLSSPGAPTSSTVLLQSPLSVIPNLANSNSILNNSLAQPSPTRTKKLSLQDYGKRKQKVEVVDKSDEKAGMRYGSDGAVAPGGFEKSPTNSEEPRKIVDSPQGLVQVVPLSPPEASSHKIVLDPARVPTGPKEHRAGNPWSVG